MNLRQPRPDPYTLADWATWEGRWELIDGQAYDMTPAPSLEHQELSMALSLRIGSQLEEAMRRMGRGGCKVYAAPTDVFLECGVVQPDLLIVCDPAKRSARGIEGAPDLVVEILSPRTSAKDTVRKRWAYEAAGIPEYLIVDPDEQVGLLLNLRAGRYEETARVEWGALVPLLGGALPIQLGDPDQVRPKGATLNEQDFLRHLLATLAYRGALCLREAPEAFTTYDTGNGKTPTAILAHLGDLLEWSLGMAEGHGQWRATVPGSWEEETVRFHRALEQLDAFLATGQPLQAKWTRLLQGPLADALTHVGQLALLRRMAGFPAKGESFFAAEITAGRVGPDQAPPKKPF